MEAREDSQQKFKPDVCHRDKAAMYAGLSLWRLRLSSYSNMIQEQNVTPE